MALSINKVRPVDPLLTKFANEYTNSEFIGDQIFPIIKVNGETGTYYTYTSKESFLYPPTRRAPGAGYARMDLNPASSTYTCQEEGQEIIVDRRLQQNSLEPMGLLRRATETAMNVIMLKREKNVMDAITNTTTFASYTETLSGSDQWSDDSSEPIDKINSWANTIRGNCGRWPNKMVISWATWLKLKEHPVVVDRVKITNDKVVTPQLLANLLDIENIYIVSALYNSAEEGQTISLADVMGKHCFLGYITPSPSIITPSVGYILQSQGPMAETYYSDELRSDVARALVIETQEIVAADCGYLGQSVIA